ncbi:unnamed protein product [Ranitomeya imitator]|uniref:Uncharacterized protein n=1 Tax=Ranitomeya imitator TaxID=111125 RepID=A0ABN9MKR7_9NEOB|nr:unnamed protein product [Ranitomeya imitator]
MKGSDERKYTFQGGTSQIADLTVCTALCQISDLTYSAAGLPSSCFEQALGKPPPSLQDPDASAILDPGLLQGGSSRCADSAVMAEQILEILHQIKSGAVPFSEVQLLHHLKSLLLLQDIERLNESLGNFKEQSSMPPDYIRALCSLFDYWITNILPIKKKPIK